MHKILLILLIFIVSDGISSAFSGKSHKKNVETIREKHFTYRNGSSDPAVNLRNAEIARYIIHHFDWTFMGSISNRDDVIGSPFVSVQMYSDGLKRESTGKLYFYLSTNEFAAEDLAQDQNTMIGLSLNQDQYCTKKGWSVKNPKCYWVSISGTFRKLEKGSEEYTQGYKYLVDRHPSIEYNKQMSGPDYFVATIDIFDVMVQSGKGELECVPMDIYYTTKPKNPHVN